MKTVLVIDGAGHDLEALQKLLQDHGYAACEVSESPLRGEEVLQQSEKRFRSIFESAPIGMFHSSLDGKLLGVNPAVFRMLKYDSPEEMLQAVNRTGIAEALYQKPGHREELLEKVLRGSGWVVSEERFRCKDDSIIDCHFHLRAVLGTDGKPVELEGFIEDVTERKQAEQALHFTQFAIDKTIDQAFWMTSDGRFFYVNEAACASLGYSREELVGMSVPDIDPLFSKEKWPLHWQELKNNGAVRLESFHRARDGRIFPVEVRANYVEFDGREYNCAFVTDITGRKRAEEALKLSQFMMDRASLGIFRGGEDARILSVNDYWARNLGYAPEELCSMTFFDIDPNLTPESWRTHRKKLAATGSNTFETKHRRKDGTAFPVEVTVNYLKYGDQSFSCSFAKDISDRKQAEEALRESEHKYRSIVEHAPFGITHSTKDGKLVSINPGLAAILKYDSAEELLETINRSSIQDVLFPEPSERAPLVENILSSDSWHVFNNRLRCKDGSIVTCRVYSRRIVDEAGRTSEFESFQENITEQMEAEQALRESEEKFRVLAETSPAAICLYQGERHIYANPAMERLIGYSADELCRMELWDWVHEDFRELIRSRGLARLTGGSIPGQYEARYVTKAGKEGYVLISAGVMVYQGQPTGIASFLDITERKRTEELIRASLREKEVLLKEIHHRVKNNLQVVSSLLFLQSQKIRDPELAALFTESQNRIYSMALAHEQLYQSKNLADLRLPEYVENLVGQIEQVFRSGEKVVCCRVDVDDIDLDIEQVVPCGLLITELLSNALRHAFPGPRTGTVSVEVRRRNDLLSLTVGDDGVGLPADLDVSSAGTLGLQLVRALTDQLDGTLELVRQAGAEFRVTFPVRYRQGLVEP